MTADSEQGRWGWRAVLLERLSVDGDWTTEPSTPEIWRKARSGKLGEGSLSDGLGGGAGKLLLPRAGHRQPQQQDLPLVELPGLLECFGEESSDVSE